MSNLFSDDNRRNPFPLYAHLRSTSPLLHDPQTNLRLVFDYPTVKRLLSDHESFSSRLGPADWMVFLDPPRHSKVRALVAKAFTPKSVSNLEPRIAALARDLLAPHLSHGQFDLALDFAVPLPMRVIAELLGVPSADHANFVRWNDAMLAMSLTLPGGKTAGSATQQFIAVTHEMAAYLAAILEARRRTPQDDLLTRLLQSEIDGQRLTDADLLNLFQLLLLAGSETTTNLINNSVLCFLENPAQFKLLQSNPALLPSAIEEVLRYRSPLQWMFRVATRDIELHGQYARKGSVLLAMMGSANHDPAVFPSPEIFNITRDPNPHLAFGHGVHFCLGAPLARLEARIALTELFIHLQNIRRTTTDPWIPRAGLHVHGPSTLPIHFDLATSV